jgi:hypothetical protein
VLEPKAKAVRITEPLELVGAEVTQMSEIQIALVAKMR